MPAVRVIHKGYSPRQSIRNDLSLDLNLEQASDPPLQIQSASKHFSRRVSDSAALRPLPLRSRHLLVTNRHLQRWPPQPSSTNAPIGGKHA